jgi:hypothetical protein
LAFANNSSTVGLGFSVDPKVQLSMTTAKMQAVSFKRFQSKGQVKMKKAKKGINF